MRKVMSAMVRLRKTGIVLVLVGLTGAFFFRVGLGKIPVSGDFSGSDLTDLHLPFKYVLHESIGRGQVPLWEANMAMGFPIVAEGQSGMLYPLNTVLGFLEPLDALSLCIVGSVFIALFSCYLFLRILGRSEAAAILGSTAFAFSAFFITRFKHLNMIEVAALFPLLLYFTKKYFDDRKTRYALALGIACGLMILAGHPQMAFYCFIALFFFIVFEALTKRRETKDKAVLAEGVFLLFCALVIGLGISAVQILPTLELYGFTERKEFTETVLTAYPYHPKNLITLIFPYHFGNPATGSYREAIARSGVFWENASYVGIVPLALAALAIFRLIKKEKDKYGLFFVLLGGVSLLMMLGKYTPLFMYFVRYVPFFELFRFPTRFNLFLIFSLATLAAFGFDEIRGKIAKGYRKPVIGGLLMITALDLMAFGNSYVAYFDKEEIIEKSQIAESLKGVESGRERYYSLTQYGDSPYTAFGWKGNKDAILAIRKTVPPNNNFIYNIDSFSDRGWFEGGLGLKRRSEVENYLLKENTNPVLIGKLLGMYNVGTILSFSEGLGIEIEKKEEFEMGRDFAAKLGVFENMQLLPRAYYVPQVEVIRDESRVWERIKDLQFNPMTTVIIEEEPAEMPPEFAGIINEFKENNKVEIKDYKDGEVVIEAMIKDHGFLVLSDSWYPGWEAFVDGSKARILRANYLVRAVELWPGEHKIIFKYKPKSFRMGAWISGLTAVFLFCLTAGLLLKNIFAKIAPRNK